MLSIPYGRQEIVEDDIAAVVSVLQSDWITQGPNVPLFESTLCSVTGASFAVAVNSATSALEVAYKALGVGSGDFVWTSPNTFIATTNAAIQCGAEVDFVDICEKTYNMCPRALEEKLAEAKKRNELPKVVVPVHFAGQPCDMPAIKKLADVYGFRIVEDASHAIGARDMDSAVGNCAHSDITVFSFHPVKIVTTGEGGAALTNSCDLDSKMRELRSHGVTTEQAAFAGHLDTEIWNFQQVCLGSNFRMTDLQAALGNSQLQRLQDFVQRRTKVANFYKQNLKGLPIRLPYQDPRFQSSYHLYPITINILESKTDQKSAYAMLRERGILVNLHYIPVYLHPFYQKRGFKRGYCPKAESYFQTALSIPIYPSLTGQQLNTVVSALSEVFV